MAELSKQVKGLHELLEVLLANCLDDDYVEEDDGSSEEE